MNAIRTHLTRTIEQRPIHAAYLRRVERTRARRANGDQAHAHAAHHTPPVLLSIR
jgi:hypothetical protein